MPRVGVDLAAVYAGVSPRSVRSWVKSGRIRNYGTARRYVVDLDEVDIFLG